MSDPSNDSGDPVPLAKSAYPDRIVYDTRMSPADLDASRGTTSLSTDGVDHTGEHPGRPAYLPRPSQGGLGPRD